MEIRNVGRAGSSGERGSVLMSSLVTVLVVASLGAAMIQMQSGVTLRQRQSVDTKRALYLAEAGLAEGFYAIALGQSGKIGSPKKPAGFGGGIFWVEATPEVDGKIGLKSTGVCGSGRFALAMTVKKSPNAIATQGLFGAQRITIGTGAIVDGYDSMLGSYESQALVPYGTKLTTGAGASIRCNGDIVVNGTTVVPLNPVPAAIYGNANPGPSNSVVAATGTLITGSTSPVSSAMQLPPIVVPNLPMRPPIDHNSSTPLLLPTGDVHFASLRVRSRAKVTIRGPVNMVVDQLLVDSLGELTFDTTEGAVTLFVTQSAQLVSQSVLRSVTNDPTSVAFLISAKPGGTFQEGPTPPPPLVLQPSGSFYGVLYAPDCDVTIPTSLRLYGSAAAKNLVLAANGRASFDKAVLKKGVAGDWVPGLQSWSITAVPEEPISSSPVDPLAFLNLQGVVPEKPAHAHGDDTVALKYTDAAGNVQTYTGLASGLNWSQVKSVLTHTWTNTNPDD